MTRIASHAQIEALGIIRDSHEGKCWATEVPFAALCDCERFGWAVRDDYGFVSITHEGRRVYRKGME